MVTLNTQENFLGLTPEWSRFDASQVVVLPIPYEHTTSYGHGAGKGPEAILEASRQVELYDEELQTETFQRTGGIATIAPMDFDRIGKNAQAVAAIRQQVKQLIDQRKFVVSLGGEHTIAVGAAQAYSEAFEDLSILQLDAHSDLRKEYEGNRYSHASVMARIFEFHRDIVQVGIRSQCAEEAAFTKANHVRTFYAVELKRSTSPWYDAVIESLKPNVYVTFDCDFLDPSLMPALGTPEPGGFGWDETVAFLKRLSSQRRVVGLDVNELAPIPTLNHPQFTVAKLIYKWLGYILCIEGENGKTGKRDGSPFP